MARCWPMFATDLHPVDNNLDGADEMRSSPHCGDGETMRACRYAPDPMHGPRGLMDKAPDF